MQSWQRNVAFALVLSTLLSWPILSLPPAAWSLPLFTGIAQEKPDEQGETSKKAGWNKPRVIHELALVRLPEGQHRHFSRMTLGAK
jgi:hypothetical protein